MTSKDLISKLEELYDTVLFGTYSELNAQLENVSLADFPVAVVIPIYLTDEGSKSIEFIADQYNIWQPFVIAEVNYIENVEEDSVNLDTLITSGQKKIIPVAYFFKDKIKNLQMLGEVAKFSDQLLTYSGIYLELEDNLTCI